MAKQKSSAFDAELLDELLNGQDPATVLRLRGPLGELKKALAERMLNAEIDPARTGAPSCAVSPAYSQSWRLSNDIGVPTRLGDLQGITAKKAETLLRKRSE